MKLFIVIRSFVNYQAPTVEGVYTSRKSAEKKWTKVFDSMQQGSTKTSDFEAINLTEGSWLGIIEENLIIAKSREISVYGHCRDTCGVYITDSKGKQLLNYDGYVPDKLGGGDDIQLDIDNRTGIIKDWIPFTDEDINKLNKI